MKIQHKITKVIYYSEDEVKDVYKYLKEKLLPEGWVVTDGGISPDEVLMFGYVIDGKRVVELDFTLEDDIEQF